MQLAIEAYIAAFIEIKVLKTVNLIDSISVALNTIAEATQEASASTEEQSATIHELTNSAQILADIISSLEVLVDRFKEKLN